MKKEEMKNKKIGNEDVLNSILQEILRFIGVSPKVTLTPQEENIVNIDIQGDNLNFLIGYKGESLNALQSLLNLIAFKQLGKPTFITVDINNYKSKKTERIIAIAKSFIDKVRFFEKEVMLPPMNPWERRHVHLLVSEYADIESESTGEGASRRVVLRPKKK
jgi:spoIIIJ-associated protein